MRKLGEEEEQALRQLASEIGAEFVKTETPYSVFPNPYIKVVKRLGNWTITLDTEEGSSGGGPDHSGSTHTFTHMGAPYVSKDGFRFGIDRNSLPMRLLLKVLRQKVVKLGDPDFDRYLLITANDEQKVWALFANSRVRRLIQRETRFPRAFQPKSHGRLVGVHILELNYTDEDLTDVERLKFLFELFEEVLNQLCRIGSASEDEPNLESVPASDRRAFGI